MLTFMKQWELAEENISNDDLRMLRHPDSH
jgi:hypothetical protein